MKRTRMRKRSRRKHARSTNGSYGGVKDGSSDIVSRARSAPPSPVSIAPLERAQLGSSWDLNDHQAGHLQGSIAASNRTGQLARNNSAASVSSDGSLSSSSSDADSCVTPRGTSPIPERRLVGSHSIPVDGYGGALKSPPDSRDFVFERMDKSSVDNTLLPREYDLREWTHPVRDQGHRDTCAAVTGAAIKETSEEKVTGDAEDMSGEFIYYHRDNKPAEGMFGRNVFSIMKNIGVVPESMYPYGTTMPPKKKHYEEAERHRIDLYAKTETVDGAKKALIDTGALYLSLPLYRSHTGLTFWRPTDIAETPSGHAVAIVGYNQEGFIIRNSWGDGWGDNGHCIFPYEDWPLHWECWMALDNNPVRRRKNKCVIC